MGYTYRSVTIYLEMCDEACGGGETRFPFFFCVNICFDLKEFEARITYLVGRR